MARRYDVNANQVFSWRRLYGEAKQPPSAPPSTSGLVPVTIPPELENVGAASPTPATSETIEIEVAGDYRVDVGTGFDGRTLKRVLDVLRKR